MNDLDAMEWADRFVLVMPCGRSAHLEAGWAIGSGKPTAILLGPDLVPPYSDEDGINPDDCRMSDEPELMYKLADLVTGSFDRVLEWLDRLDSESDKCTD